MPTAAARRASVSLDAPDEVLEGATMAVRVSVEPPEGAGVLGGEVTLSRVISYRYRRQDDDGGTRLAPVRRNDVVGAVPLPAAPGGPGPYVADVLVPVPTPGPPSADAGLVAVDWSLRARVLLGAGGWAQAVRRVAVVTTAAEFGDVRDRPPHTDDRGHTVVAIDHLSSRRIAPGEHLTGDVVAAPLHAGPIRAVRLELLLCAHVPAGAARPADAVGTKDAATVVAGVELAAAIEVPEDLPLVRLPFELEVPAVLPGPSMVTPDFALEWALRAVVSRPLHRDAYAEVALQGATAVAG